MRQNVRFNITAVEQVPPPESVPLKSGASLAIMWIINENYLLLSF